MALTDDKVRKGLSMKSLSSSKGNVSDTNYLYEHDDKGLGCRFFDKLNHYKDKIHQVDAVSGLTETNGSLRLRSIQVAMEMQSRGIHENDTVLVCSRGHSDQTVAVLATLFVGAIVVPLDPEAAQVDFKNVVVSVKPKMAFCDIRASGQLEIIIRDSSEMPACPIVVFGIHTDRLIFEKFLLQKPNPEFKAVVIKDPKRRVAFIVSSQSTSGHSKLICISHHAIRIQINYAHRVLKGAEKVLSFFPLSWITQIAIVCYCYDTAIIRILPGVFVERSACKLIHDLRIDFAALGTDFAMRIVRHASVQDYDLSCLTTIYVGGVLTTAFDMAFLRTSIHDVKVLQCYGMTEMSCLVAGFLIEDYEAALERPASVGKPLPGVKFKIVDFETREVLGPDWWGELLISGPTLMLGYYKDVEGTNAALDKGYFKTGDIAQYDSDGYLYIQGRASDHIMINGHSCCPTEIEEMITTHPYIQEVVVLGDEKDVVACVIRKPGSNVTAEQIMEYVVERMPENKRPTKIKFMESFPKTSVGKLRRNTIKQTVLGITIVHSKSVVCFEGKP